MKIKVEFRTVSSFENLEEFLLYSFNDGHTVILAKSGILKHGLKNHLMPVTVRKTNAHQYTFLIQNVCVPNGDFTSPNTRVNYFSPSTPYTFSINSFHETIVLLRHIKKI